MRSRWWRRRAAVRRSALIPASAAEVWELVSDSELFEKTAVAEHLWTFVLPGTPAGLVGERRVTLTGAGDDHVTATLVERTDLEGGRRVVTRNLTNGIEVATTVEPRSAVSCELTFRVRPVRPTDELLTASRLDARLARVSAYVEGRPRPPEGPNDPVPVDEELRAGQAVAVGTVPAQPADVWEAVRTAGGRLEHSTAGAATVVTVPGTPAGEVGEQICIVAVDPPWVQVLEVVALDVGRSQTVRYRTAHTKVERTVSLRPSGRGTEVTITIDFVAPERDLADHVLRMQHVAETFLRCAQS